MVLRVEARRAHGPFDRFDVAPLEGPDPRIAVYSSMLHEQPASLRILRYPDGQLVEESVGERAVEARARMSRDFERAPDAFDFDADGVQDTTEGGWGDDYRYVRVRSGADRRVLFENYDPLEYECSERAIPLGDVDGDGFSELAVLHPRADRSRYDFPELGDRMFGAKSWITIVSGSRLAR